jgi:hypothetical protein
VLLRARDDHVSLADGADSLLGLALEESDATTLSRTSAGSASPIPRAMIDPKAATFVHFRTGDARKAPDAPLIPRETDTEGKQDDA